MVGTTVGTSPADDVTRGDVTRGGVTRGGMTFQPMYAAAAAADGT